MRGRPVDCHAGPFGVCDGCLIGLLATQRLFDRRRPKMAPQISTPCATLVYAAAICASKKARRLRAHRRHAPFCWAHDWRSLYSFSARLSRLFRPFPESLPNHMDPIYLTGIVGFAGALSTLLGVSITSRTQVANQRINNEFQLALAQEKARNDQLAKFSDTAAAQLATAHKLLSHIGREFSVTGLNIMWTATMSVEDFNAKYMALCEKADELLMIVDFHAPEASERCREIYGQMNMYWGNFGNVLHLTAAGKKVDHNTHCFRQAHDAAREIGEKSVFAKSTLRRSYESRCVTG